MEYSDICKDCEYDDYKIELYRSILNTIDDTVVGGMIFWNSDKFMVKFWTKYSSVVHYSGCVSRTLSVY